MKDPVVLTTFSSHLSIKTFNPKDINPNFDKAEHAENINKENWEGLEDNCDDETTRDSNDQVQQPKSNSKKKKKKKSKKRKRRRRIVKKGRKKDKTTSAP